MQLYGSLETKNDITYIKDYMHFYKFQAEVTLDLQDLEELRKEGILIEKKFLIKVHYI